MLSYKIGYQQCYRLRNQGMEGHSITKYSNENTSIATEVHGFDWFLRYVDMLQHTVSYFKNITHTQKEFLQDKSLQSLDLSKNKTI